ncbi:hypothetical protein [Catalinimonas niigatensis]|uniref:hypothetical protein n=1 Tax=Catalinimonas niigatensis TaxID=1397264 RepID=UPI002665C244|nr:hypothetical protein [Catalinimonas niigatensis]WPP50610.1 hypothetical protein PZB72_28505 [Catalinimonas niigatensis]
MKIHTYLKICSTLDEGEEIVRNFKNRKPPLEHLSVLGKVTGFLEPENTASFAKLTSTAIHLLYVSDIGKIFVAGPLSSLLLEKIDGKALGSLEGGLVGILNGYGVSKNKTLHYLDHLRNGKLMVMAWEYARTEKRDNSFAASGKPE